MGSFEGRRRRQSLCSSDAASPHWCAKGGHPIWRLNQVKSLPRSYAAELGYEVTVVKDATASYSDVEMPAALDVNISPYTSPIVTTDEIVDSISPLPTPGISAGN
jgi:hypothetical protein